MFELCFLFLFAGFFWKPPEKVEHSLSHFHVVMAVIVTVVCTSNTCRHDTGTIHNSCTCCSSLYALLQANHWELSVALQCLQCLLVWHHQLHHRTLSQARVTAVAVRSTCASQHQGQRVRKELLVQTGKRVQQESRYGSRMLTSVLGIRNEHVYVQGVYQGLASKEGVHITNLSFSLLWRGSLPEPRGKWQVRAFDENRSGTKGLLCLLSLPWLWPDVYTCKVCKCNFVRRSSQWLSWPLCAMSCSKKSNRRSVLLYSVKYSQ